MNIRLVIAIAACGLLVIGGCKQQGGKTQNEERAGQKVSPAPTADNTKVEAKAEVPAKAEAPPSAEVAAKVEAKPAAKVEAPQVVAKPVPTKPGTAVPQPVRPAPKAPAPVAQGPKAAADRMEAGTKGGDNPKVWIVEVSDFQCPFCGRVNPTIKQIMDTYGDAVAISFYHNALPFHKDARPAAIATMAAAKQGKFWEMHDKLFANQRALKPNNLEAYAKEIGLDMAKYAKDFADPAIGARVDRDQAMANAVGATGTPAFFINGKALKGAQPFPKFKEIIDAEIAEADKAGKRGKDFTLERIKANNADLHGYLTWTKEPPVVAARQPQKARPVDKTVYKVTVDPKDAMKGNVKEALVTLVEFSEFQCPFCSRINPTVAKVMETYGDKVRVVFKHNPLPFHKDAMPASEAALCAKDQGKFWEMHDKLFANQRALKADNLTSYATELGLDLGKFKKCMDSNTHKAQIEADMDLAGKVTARGTPNTFVNGRKLTGAKPFDEFKTVIDEELTKAEALVAKGISKDKVYEEITKDGKVFEPLEAKVNDFDLSKTAVHGKPDAKIKIVEFSDFQCPFCARVTAPLKDVQKHYGDDAAIFFKHFPLSFHKQAMPAAIASVCANQQGKFWEFHDITFANFKELSAEKITEWAGKVGLDAAKFATCQADPATKQQVEADMAEARKAGVRGTPSLYINGRKFSSPSGYSLSAFTSVIDKHVLKK